MKKFLKKITNKALTRTYLIALAILILLLVISVYFKQKSKNCPSKEYNLRILIDEKVLNEN